MRHLLLISLISLSSATLSAQYCPPSTTKGVHIIQKGETLYGLSKVYKTTVAALCQLNGIQETDILSICSTLNVGNTEIAQASPDVPTNYAYTPPKKTKAMPYFKTNVKIHTVKKEETLDMIAEYYGYTRARLMYMNNIRNPENYYVGQQLVVNDCDGLEPVSTTPPQTIYATPSEISHSEVPQSYNTISKPMASTSIQTSFGNPNYSWNPAYKKVVHVVSQDQMSQKETPESIGRLHGLSGAEVIAMNNLNPNTSLKVGQRLFVEERLEGSEALVDGFFSTNSANTMPMPPPQYNASLTEVPTSYNNNTTSYMNAASTPATTVNNTTSMTKDEMSMVNEINLVRSNPAGYIIHIEKYIADLQKEGNNQSAIAAARELIAELFRLPNLSTLQPMECIYNAAKKHGADQLRRGNADHQGSDGSMPWDRVLRECPSLKDGNENLVGGPADIRTAVIILLVDDGIQSRGHRRTMLQADWRYVACHKMGTIGGMPNYWVQKFGN
jgi:LysM repeat protein